MIKRNQSINLFWVVENALAEMESLSTVQRVIPIAWPVFEAEHQLRIMLVEELALVERHILEAVARFGPISSAEIGKIMGLDGDMVEHLVGKLERFPDIILREGNELRAAAGVLERVSAERWTREVIQPYAFWVNGPTGRLLPIKAIGQSTSEIVVDFESGGFVISRAGQKLDTMYWIASSQGDGSLHLSSMVRSTDSEQRREFGIPEGAFALESTNKHVAWTRWEFAIGELIENDCLRIRLARRPDVILAEVAQDAIHRFGEMLRRGDRTFQHLAKADGKGAAEREKAPTTWGDFADCRMLGRNLVITLNQPDAIPLIEQDDDDERDERSVKPPRDLLIVLGRPYYWHPYHFTVRQVVPGNPETAAFMLKLRALGLLRKLADQDRNEFNFEEWWTEAQIGIIESWPGNSRPGRVLWQEIRDIALRSTDSDLVEFVSESL